MLRYLTAQKITSLIVFVTVTTGSVWLFAERFTSYPISTGNVLVLRTPRPVQERVPEKEQPEQLIDILSDKDLVHDGYEVKSLTKKVRYRDREIEVSYAVLMKNHRRLLKFDGDVHFSEGNDTEFGVFDLLGRDSEQIVVSQTVPRGGRHWVVRVSPDVRVLFDSGDYGVGREEFNVIDIDKDGVYEIVFPVTAFYSMQDKMYIGEIPLTEIIFKYDKKARRYLPANDHFAAYALDGIERDVEGLRSDDDSNYLSKRLRILLRYVYARKQTEGWSFFARAYQRNDRKEVEARIRAVLQADRLYNYLY
jgi:hypothetical protein